MTGSDAPASNTGVVPMALTVQTAPPGAEVRAVGTTGCRTPCELMVVPMGPFTIDLALDGYEPQTVEVLLAPINPRDLSAGIRLNPNPLSVALVEIPRPPPPPPPPKPVAKKKKPNVVADRRPAMATSPWPR